MNTERFDLYTDYLISSFGPTTATGLAALLDGRFSHDQVTRSLASEPKTSADLWKVVKPLVRAVESADATISIDDSISEKPYTDENEIIAWHWNHCFGLCVKGLEFLTAYYQADGVSLPMALNIDAQKDFIMPLKSNRKVALSENGNRSGCYLAVSTLDLPENTTCQVWLEAVPFPVLLIKQVFTNQDGSTGIRCLVTSDLTLAYDQITKLFQKRWGIEVYHKSLKQNASLEKSPTRTATTQRKHLFASLCAYVKLERLKIKTSLSHFALKSELYLSAVKSAYSEFVKLKEHLAAA